MNRKLDYKTWKYQRGCRSMNIAIDSWRKRKASAIEWAEVSSRRAVARINRTSEKWKRTERRLSYYKSRTWTCKKSWIYNSTNARLSSRSSSTRRSCFTSKSVITDSSLNINFILPALFNVEYIYWKFRTREAIKKSYKLPFPDSLASSSSLQEPCSLPAQPAASCL